MEISDREWSIMEKFQDRYSNIINIFNTEYPDSYSNNIDAIIMLLIHEGIDLVDDIEELKKTVSDIKEDIYNKQKMKLRLNSVYGTTHAEPVNLGDTDAIIKLKKEHDLMKAALLIMDNCKGKKKCEDCVFYRKDKPFSLQCGVENNVPSNWVLEKEVKDNV